jgi:hypothetical protein
MRPTYGQDDQHPLGVTEAYLEYRPYPIDGWRTRVRIGAYYPPVSLEDYGVRLVIALHAVQFRSQFLARRGGSHHRG